jgi:hypothetical protein
MAFERSLISELLASTPYLKITVGSWLCSFGISGRDLNAAAPLPHPQDNGAPPTLNQDERRIRGKSRATLLLSNDNEKADYNLFSPRWGEDWSRSRNSGPNMCVFILHQTRRERAELQVLGIAGTQPTALLATRGITSVLAQNQ